MTCSKMHTALMRSKRAVEALDELPCTRQRRVTEQLARGATRQHERVEKQKTSKSKRTKRTTPSSRPSSLLG